MIIFGMSVIGSCWSSSDGEEYFGNPDFFEEQQDQQDFVNQGKYSVGLLWCPIHFNHLLILHVSNFDHHKDFLVFDNMLLDSYEINCMWIDC
jgi:hypothetical protein